MRTHHTPHALSGFPIYSAAFVTDEMLVLGGGGGSSRSGIKNKLRLYKTPNDETLELLSELELENGEDAPMSMDADKGESRIVCGINSAIEELNEGINNNCRLYNVTDDSLHLDRTASTLQVTSANIEDCQKITSISPGLTLVAAAGARDLTILQYPSLAPAAKSLHAEHDIYDVSFSTKAVVVATTSNLLVYDLPPAIAPNGSASGYETRSKKKRQKKAQAPSLTDLVLLKSVERPTLSGIEPGMSSFRAVRFHPISKDIAYTVLNATLPSPRSRAFKISKKQGFVCRWNADIWEVSKIRKIGERGITCFDVSSNGKFLAYGSADYSIGILDAVTLAPLLSILKAHEFPPTVIRFNPSSSLLVSGSADNSVRLVAVPDSLAGTTWTTGSVLLVTLFVLLISILLSYLYSSGTFKW